jgi:zeaxanthin glucosyltransferase
MKIGFASMPLSGHLNPMAALARKLQSRGNDVVMIGVPDVEPVAQAANLAFVPFCEKEYPFGSTAELWTQVAKLHGLDVVKYSLEKFSPGIVAAAMEHLPATIAEAGIEALVLDTVYSFLELVPISLGIPYVQAWVVLNLDLSSSTPLCLFGLPHETTPEALTRNAEESAMGRPVPRTDRRAGSGTLC